jgi:hypothetical protein
MEPYAVWEEAEREGFALFEARSRVTVVIDYDYDPMDIYRHSIAPMTVNEKAQVEEEQRQLADGAWVALGFVLEEECEYCKHWEEVDAIYGCVLDTNDTEAQMKEAELHFDIKIVREKEKDNAV